MGFDLDFRVDFLNTNSVHQWSFNINSSDAITVTVAPGSNANIVLSLIGPNDDTLVDRQNQASAGQVETIRNFSLTDSGTHKIEIRSDPPASTNYALMVMDSESYSFIFKGTLVSDQQRMDTSAADNDHLWLFEAEDGDSISFTVRPDGDEDPYLELYGADGTRVFAIDNGDIGEEERLEDYSILASGLYTIRVGEFDYQPMPYRILFTN